MVPPALNLVRLSVTRLAFFLDFFELSFIIVPLLAPVADKLGIDLIKIKTEGLTDDQKQQRLNEKYREMGVTDKVEELPEVPGGIWKPMPGENFDSPM